jgi:hypothetical protein
MLGDSRLEYTEGKRGKETVIETKEGRKKDRKKGERTKYRRKKLTVGRQKWRKERKELNFFKTCT